MNPERRGQKIGERLNDAIADEPSPDERRRQVERSLLEPPPPEIKSKLLRWYGGRCQVAGCDRRFAEDDGKPFFCATYFLPLKEARFGATVGNAICLCADHFAQWQCAHRLPTDGLDRRVLRAERPVDGQRASILFGELCCDTDVVIEYHPVHLQELQVFVRKVFPSGLPLRDVDE
jgi:hypothetical protein